MVNRIKKEFVMNKIPEEEIFTASSLTRMLKNQGYIIHTQTMMSILKELEKEGKLIKISEKLNPKLFGNVVTEYQKIEK